MVAELQRTRRKQKRVILKYSLRPLRFGVLCVASRAWRLAEQFDVEPSFYHRHVIKVSWFCHIALITYASDVARPAALVRSDAGVSPARTDTGKYHSPRYAAKIGVHNKTNRDESRIKKSAWLNNKKGENG